MDVTSTTEVPLERLEAEICSLAGHIAAATYPFLVLLAEFDRREGWGQWEVPSCAHWLNWKCSMSLRTAREHLSVAHRLGELPVTAAAMSRGELSFSKVRAICRMATPVTEAGLVEAAKSDFDPVGDGTTVITARVRDDEAAVAAAALQAAMDATGERPGERLVAQRRADALVAVCEGFLAHPDRCDDERYQVVVHVDEPVLTGDGHGICATEQGHPVSAATVKRLLCSADLTRLVQGPDGPVAISSKRRIVPRRLRRALRARDGHCRFPGCTNQHVDAHHIEHWIDGGPTELANLTALCRRHHKLVHDQGWTIETVDGRLRFRHPAGWIYGETEPVLDDPGHHITGPDHASIRPETIQTDWENRPIDWDTWLHTLTHAAGNGSAEPSHHGSAEPPDARRLTPEPRDADRT